MPVAQVRDFEAELYKYVDSTNPGLLRAICAHAQSPDISSPARPKEVLLSDDPPEPGARTVDLRGEAVEEAGFPEHHAQVGGELGHKG